MSESSIVFEEWHIYQISALETCTFNHQGDQIEVQSRGLDLIALESEWFLF